MDGLRDATFPLMGTSQVVKIPVSVIIPVYNTAVYLDECLSSVFSQTLKGIEVICINDGSTDSSADILEKWYEKYPNMVVINQENRGAGAARNVAIGLANGEFVAFLDSDDFYAADDALETLYAAAVSENVKICGGNFLRYFEEKITRPIPNKVGTVPHFPQVGRIHFRDWQNMFAYWAYIYNREFLLENGVYFFDSNRFEDAVFLLRAMVAAEDFYHIDKDVLAYRHTDKVVRRDSSEVVAGVLSAFIEMMNIASCYNLPKVATLIIYNMDSGWIFNVANNLSKGDERIAALYDGWQISIKRVSLESEAQDVFDVLPDKLQKLMNEAAEFKEEIGRFIVEVKDAPIIIYGAGESGRLLYTLLRERGMKNQIFFAITTKGVDTSACGQRVHCIGDLANNLRNVQVIVSVGKSDVASEMARYARELGFGCVRIWEYQKLLLVI